MADTYQNLTHAVSQAVAGLEKLKQENKMLSTAREKDAERIRQLEGKIRQLESVSQKLGEIIKKVETAV